MDVFSSSNSSFSIVNHRLMGGGVIHLECPKNRRGLGEPDMIILHYTAGMDAMSSAKFLVKPDVKASAHVVIGRDGQVIQMVPCNIEAWHAGRSSYGGRSGLNHYSVGIELDNLGQLRQEGGKFVAVIGDVDLCCYRTYRHFHEFAHVVGYIPVLGFAGDLVGRVCGGEEWGKNGGGHF